MNSEEIHLSRQTISDESATVTADAFATPGSPTRITQSPHGGLGQISGAVGLVVACFAMFAASGATAADNCPNAQFRVGPSANLPDCRTYEQVSPVDKRGADIASGLLAGTASDGTQNRLLSLAADTGDAATFGAAAAFSSPLLTNPAESSYVAHRDPELGWITSNVTVPVAHSGSAAATTSSLELVSGDMSRVVGKQLQTGLPALTTGAQTESPNAYIRDIANESWELVTTSAPTTPRSTWFSVEGGSKDLSHVIFQTNQDLSPAAVGPSPTLGAENLYEYTDGVTRLVNVLPDGSASSAHIGLGSRSAPDTAVSSDGSRIFFSSSPSGQPGQLYLREADATPARTIWVSAPEPGAPNEPARVAVFQGASKDGASAFFTSKQKLTTDSTAGEASQAQFGYDLYRYEVEDGELTDITIDGSSPDGASVRAVLGLSEDGSEIYFVANGALLSLWG